jgi:tight adherence protein B
VLSVVGVAMVTVIRERAELREQVHHRFEHVAKVGAAVPVRAGGPRVPALAWIDERLRRAGIEPHPWQAVAATVGVVLLTGTAALLRGPLGAFLMLGLLALTAHWVLSWLAGRRRARILEQLPGFLDHVVRAVQTGSSLPNAMFAATAEASEPIHGVFQRVVRQTRLGVSIEESLEQASVLHSVRELRILALSVRVSQRYGGSVREVLGSIVGMIRRREQTQREFRAMTGETRLSAMLLAGLPVVLAVYVMIVNPDYLGRMTSDDAGRIALWISGGLQVLGSVVLWRMVRSV